MANKGEWAEIYAFLKLLVDGTMCEANDQLEQVNEAYSQIDEMLREEQPGHVLSYQRTGESILIEENGEAIQETPLNEYEEIADLIWARISGAARGQIEIPEALRFLEGIRIQHLAAPAMPQGGAHYFGGVEDLVLKMHRNGVQQELGFSCKSILGASPTLFNASGATNFIFRLNGPVNDAVMATCNSMFNARGAFAIGDRIRFLKENRISVEFERGQNENAERNLNVIGGNEMYRLVGELLKYYYWVNEAGNEYSSLTDALRYLVDHNVLNLNFQDLEDIYSRKLRDLLFEMYTGMRFGRRWNGRPIVNGGLAIVKNNGQVLAYFNNNADQFGEYLLHSTKLETSSARKHGYMSVFRENGEYKIKFNLQIRFRPQE